MDGGGIVVSQDTLLIAGVVLFAALMLLVLAVIVVGILIFTRMGRVRGGEVFQAPADFLSEDDLAGMAGVFSEGGTRAHQAGMGDGEVDPAALKAAREYREAMKVVDRQVERATRAVLDGKRQGGTGQAPVSRLLDPDFWGGPHQAAAPGVKDE